MSFKVQQYLPYEKIIIFLLNADDFLYETITSLMHPLCVMFIGVRRKFLIEMAKIWASISAKK